MRRCLLLIATFIALNGMSQYGACLDSLAVSYKKYDAVVFVKSPFCSGCLYDVRPYLDSIGVSPKMVIALFEKSASAAQMVRIEEMLQTKMKLKPKDVLAVEKLSCPILSGIYVATIQDGKLEWKTIP